MHLKLIFFICFYFLDLCKRNSALFVAFLTQTLRELEDSYTQMKSISWLWNFWHMLALSGCQSEPLDIQLMSLHSFELSITLFWVLVNTFLKVYAMLLLKFYVYSMCITQGLVSVLSSLSDTEIFPFYISNPILYPDILVVSRREKGANGVLGIGFFLKCIYELKHSEKRAVFVVPWLDIKHNYFWQLKK